MIKGSFPYNCYVIIDGTKHLLCLSENKHLLDLIKNIGIKPDIGYRLLSYELELGEYEPEVSYNLLSESDFEKDSSSFKMREFYYSYEKLKNKVNKLNHDLKESNLRYIIKNIETDSFILSPDLTAGMHDFTLNNHYELAISQDANSIVIKNSLSILLQHYDQAVLFDKNHPLNVISFDDEKDIDLEALGLTNASPDVTSYNFHVSNSESELNQKNFEIIENMNSEVRDIALELELEYKCNNYPLRPYYRNDWPMFISDLNDKICHLKDRLQVLDK